MIKLGVLGCAHGKVSFVKKIVKKFTKESIDAVVITGDINSMKQPYKSIVKVLGIIAKLKIPVYVIVGSHESPDKFAAALRRFRKNKYIKNCTLWKNRRITINDYDLVFLPGSTSFAAGKGGRFLLYRDKKRIRAFKKRLKLVRKVCSPGFFKGRFKLFFVNSLRKLVRNPKRTILISHIPPKFNKPGAIDRAKFGAPKKEFQIKPKHLKALEEKEPGRIPLRGVVFELESARKFIKYGYPIKIKEKNVGDVDLKRLLRKLKIKKQICSHIHEAGQRGCDSKGNRVQQGRWSKELFYNPGSAEEGKAGIYIIEEDKAKYKNIKIKV